MSDHALTKGVLIKYLVYKVINEKEIEFLKGFEDYYEALKLRNEHTEAFIAVKIE